LSEDIRNSKKNYRDWLERFCLWWNFHVSPYFYEDFFNQYHVALNDLVGESLESAKHELLSLLSFPALWYYPLASSWIRCLPNEAEDTMVAVEIWG
jgi:hypothetical protein